MRAFPHGTDDTRTLYAGSVLVGEDLEQTTFKLIASSVVPGWTNARVILAEKETRISNLTFDGSRADFDRDAISWYSTSLVQLQFADDSVVEYLRVHDGYGQKDYRLFKESFGVNVVSSSTVIVRQIEAFDMDGSGVAVAGHLYRKRPSNALIENVLAYNNRAQGVSFYVVDNSVARNLITYNTRRGINIAYGNNILIENAETYSNEWFGVGIGGMNSGIGLRNITSWNNGTDTGYAGATEIAILAGIWHTEPAQDSTAYAAGILTDITVENLTLTPREGRPHVVITTTLDEWELEKLWITDRFPGKMNIQSPGSEAWIYRLDGVDVPATQLHSYVVTTYGIVLKPQ